MIKYKELFARLQQNEKIAKKFHEIEIKILSIYNFKDLFEALLSEIQNQFRVPYVWISLIDGNEVSTLIQTLATSNHLRERMSIVDRKMFADLIKDNQKPLLVNENLHLYCQLLPPNHSYQVKSMAVAPISLYGKVIGSFNQADFTKERFQPGIETTLLEQLAIKVSLCLSNVVAHEKLQFMAFYDPLTGLLNRRVMESILKREFVRVQRYQTPLSVAFIDVNDFKQINDTFGHDTGDELLKHIASLLVDMSRQSDVATRFAGDEFVLICPETSANSTETMLMRLKGYIKDHPLVIESNRIPFSISYGIASTEDETILDPSALLKKADEALYWMKNARFHDYFGVSQS
jgi:diguanylate cyclase (GGDEF)-like protein